MVDIGGVVEDVVVVDGVVGGNVMMREERSNIGAIEGGGSSIDRGCCKYPRFEW